MGDALAAMITSAAGTGAPTNPNGRYYGASIEEYDKPDGTPVKYLARRIVPQPDVYTATQQYVVHDGDRIDNLAAKTLGDPTLFWAICDLNAALEPGDLTDEPGQTILIPLASGIPPQARNG